MTKFEFVKKDGRKFADCNKVIKLIQDVEALDSICKKVLQEDEEHRCKGEERNSNSRGKLDDDSKHSNNPGYHDK